MKDSRSTTGEPAPTPVAAHPSVSEIQPQEDIHASFMEDYAGAFAARHLDVEALLSSEPMRSTAAVHIGGIAVECQIKALDSSAAIV